MTTTAQIQTAVEYALQNPELTTRQAIVRSIGEQHATKTTVAFVEAKINDWLLS